MKSKMKRRMLAIVLCMVIALSNSSFIFASSGTEEPAAVAQEGDPQNVQETQTEAAVQDTPAVLSETTPEATPEATPEPTQVPEVTAAPTEAPQATAEPTQAPEVTAAPEATPAPTETPAVTAESTQAPEVTAAPEATPVPTEAPVTYNEAVELRHEFKDENGNVTATVTAQIPAGAFQADASELTMEVKVPDQAATEKITKLMEERLPENYILGDTVFYDIRFKVNGTQTESQQPITITFESKEGLEIEDVKKAVVFQLDPADPAVEGDKDELVTITQRNDMIESLQNSGQSTDNVDDYDLSEITLKEDGTSNKIQMEGRTSTIYGCYVETLSEEKTMSQKVGDITVSVKAPEGAFSVNSDLVTMTADPLTEEQKELVEEQLQKQADAEGMEVGAYVAYDINLWADGEKIQPQVPVTVTFENTGLESYDADETTGFQVDETSEQITTIEETSQTEEKVEVTAEHFTITGVYNAIGNTPLALGTDNNESLAESYWPTGAETNEWQIVRENYKKDGSSAEPYFPSADNTDVRIQKNVLPTENENEFYIYLNVEPQLSWEEVLKMTGIWAINSNSTSEVEELIGQITGDTEADWIRKQLSKGGSHVSRVGDYELFDSEYRGINYDSVNNGSRIPVVVEYRILKADGTEETVVLNNQYFKLPSGKIQTILIRLPFRQYYSKADAIYENGKLTVEIQETDLFEGTDDYVLRNDKVKLSSVSDPMGNFIEFKQIEECTNDSQAQENDSTITWAFPQDKELSTDFQDYEIVDLGNGTKTVYWKHAYELVYKIRLDTKADDFEFGKVYDTNKTRTLTYSTETEEDKTADFLIPAVKSRTFDSFVSVDKKVEVVDYDDRTYRITLSAKSILDQIEQQGEPVDVVLVFDTSRSMDFPGNLQPIGQKRVGSLDKGETYYYIEPKSAATVYKVSYNYKEGYWEYIDSSARPTDDKPKTPVEIDEDSPILNSEKRYDFYQAADDSTRLDALEAAAGSFVKKLHDLSEENRVGLVTFSEDAKVKRDLTALSENYETFLGLLSDMSNLTASGTNQAKGLEEAIDMFEKSSSENDKYVILLTDGAPNWKVDGSQVAVSKCWEEIEKKANTLKNQKVTLMTLGVGLSYVDAGIKASNSGDPLASDKLKSIASSDGDESYFYETDNANDLEALFDNMFSVIVSGVPIQGVTVTDIIDSRFELVMENGSSVPQNGVYDPSTGTLTWSDVTLPYVSSGDKGGWSVSFTIKAKDEFMGGNVIPTNGSSSGVSLEGTTVPFPQPAVNVKSLGLDVPDKEITVFLGDSIQSIRDSINEINSVKAQKVESDREAGDEGWFDIPESCKISASEILQLLNGGNVSKSYSYPGTADIVGNFVYSINVVKTMKPDATGFDGNFTANKVGEAQEEYELTVQYVPIGQNDRTPGYGSYEQPENPSANKDSITTSATGKYIVNVIAGQIVIKKEILSKETSDQTFKFKIEKEDGESVEATVTIEEGTTEGTVSVGELSRGTYTVTEIESGDYSLAETSVVENETTCKFESSESGIFVIGKNTDGTDAVTTPDVDNKGTVKFVNEKALARHWDILKVSGANTTLRLNGAEFTLTKKDESVPDYIGKSEGTLDSGEEKGYVQWYKADEQGNAMEEKKTPEQGTYILAERKAPLGYTLSEETWTIEINANGSLKSVSSSDGAQIRTTTTTETVDGAEVTVVHYLFENTALYDLPSAGGSGIFWYLISGTAFMMAASLILYRMKRKEVLGK